MSATPRILVTNDDGIDAPGLAVMIEIARAISDDVHVLAPLSNQSGAGHRFSLRQELVLERREARIYTMDGSPADCVVIGCTHLLEDRRPDIVLSGVNHGQNLGDIIHCSGTVAGAREGALHGALGIAMSQAVNYDREQVVHWECAAAHGAAVVKALWDKANGRETYYNVNFPAGPPAEVSGMRVVPHQRFSRSPFAYYASQNEGRFFVAVPETPMPVDPEHDFHVLLNDRAITVTPLCLQVTDAAAAAGLRDHFAGLIATPSAR